MNKGKRAPVGAFDPNIDPMTGLPRKAGTSGGKSSLRGDPYAAAEMSGEGRSSDEKAFSRPSVSTNGSRNRSATAPLVPSLSMHAEDSESELSLQDDVDADRDADAERVWRSRQGYHTQPSHIPDSRFDVSNPNADGWGVSAEPWQDFAQPKARTRSTLSPYSAANGDRSGTTSAASSVLDMEAIMTGKTKADRNQKDLEAGSASPFPEPNWDEKLGTLDAPQRSKSLIKRIKSMRENPNVPSPEEGVEMGSVREGRRRRAAQHKYSPSTPPLRQDTLEGSASYDARAAADAAVGTSSGGSYGRRAGRSAPQDSDNVLTPRDQRDADQGYFQADQDASRGRAVRSPGETGLSRNGSLFGKLKRGQKATSKSTERPTAYA
jgi:hypothetical protein